MNEKANYGKGRRRELTKQMMSYGMVLYRSLRYLDETDKKMSQRILREMERENTVRFAKDPKIVYLKNPTANKKLMDAMPEGYGYQNMLSAQKRNRALVSSCEESYRIRLYKTVDTLMFMSAAGVLTLPDKKPVIRKMITKEMQEIDKDDIEPYKEKKEDEPITIDAKGSYYYTSTDYKSITGYVDLIGSSSKKVIGSRSLGCMLSGGNVYVVYHVGQNLIEWKQRGEERMAHHLAQLFSKIYEPYIGQTDVVVDRAIVLAEDDFVFQQIIENESSTLMNIDYTYQKMYGVTLDISGRRLLEKMKDSNFENRIMASILDDGEIHDSNMTRTACDGYNKETKVYSMVFCSPDICKLKHFIKAAYRDNDKKKYRIYCYTHQLPLIISLAGEYAEIYSMDID